MCRCSIKAINIFFFAVLKNIKTPLYCIVTPIAFCYLSSIVMTSVPNIFPPAKFDTRLQIELIKTVYSSFNEPGQTIKELNLLTQFCGETL